MQGRIYRSIFRTTLSCSMASSLIALALAVPAFAADLPRDGDLLKSGEHPGCDQIDAKACVEQAMAAMGGRQRLANIRNVSYEAIGHRVLSEESPRQEPFISAYERDRVSTDFLGQRLVRDERSTWPAADLPEADQDMSLVATPHGCVYHAKQGDSPCWLSDLDDTRDALALGPERLLLNAAAAKDLHYVPSQWLRATPHTVIEFTWQGAPVRVLLNAYNHLPDAIERTRTFNEIDFWFAWGDVEQRIYFDHWYVVQGVVFPTNRIDQRNGILYASTQLLHPIFNALLDEKRFVMDAAMAAKSTQSQGWNRSFSDKGRVELAPGVELFQGSWNTTLIRQDDGVLVLEAPIAPSYMQGVFAKAHSEYGQLPIKGVLSTSDSWPHVAGVREAVAEGLPVYALDLNRPLLDRLVSAAHRLRPDTLQSHPKVPHWIDVGGPLQIGQGANRVMLYPLRGAATERQYMVYFPQHRLLYASDTLQLNPDHSLSDPEMMYEVTQAVAREHLQVDTVFSMHEGPTPWSDVLRLVNQAMLK
ncbi:MAG: MBL fold metallo-hydrolase [Rhodanobacter sp.]